LRRDPLPLKEFTMSTFSTELSHHLHVRPWRTGDERPLVEHANNREVWNNLRDSFPHPYTQEDAVRWIEFVASQGEPPKRFAVVLNEEPIGGVGLMVGSDVSSKVAEVGYWIGQAHWGKGIATKALRWLSRYAFESFDVVRLHASIFESNRASTRVMEKAGYRLEGRLRQSVFKNGQVIDSLMYSLLRQELSA
jgi:RimJ/RimL family protein N-acetyltransferase